MASTSDNNDLAVADVLISCGFDDLALHTAPVAVGTDTSVDRVDDDDASTFVLFGVDINGGGANDLDTGSIERPSADWTKSVPEDWVVEGRFTECEAKVLREFSQTQWNGFPWRDYQLKITLALLRGKDALAIVPTGLGKSAPYSVLPALQQREGQGKFIVVVFQPLVCLIADQTEKLLRLYPDKVVSLTGETTKESVKVVPARRSQY